MSVQVSYPLYTPAFLADPYPTYARLRAEAPVYWHPDSGRWVFTRYEDVDAVLRDPRWSANRVALLLRRRPEAMQEELRPLFGVLAKQFLFLDPPDHTRLRGLVSKAFTPRVTGSTSASARPSGAWKRRSPSRRCCGGFPGFASPRRRSNGSRTSLFAA